MKFVGTKRGVISNTESACFWIDKGFHLKCEDLKIEMKCRGGWDWNQGIYSPNIVNFSGILTMLRCDIINRADGFCLLAHGQTFLRSCNVTISGFGLCVHFDGELDSFGIPKINFFDNTFCSQGMNQEFGGSFFLGEGLYSNKEDFVSNIMKSNKQEIIYSTNGMDYDGDFDGGY